MQKKKEKKKENTVGLFCICTVLYYKPLQFIIRFQFTVVKINKHEM